MQNNNHPDFVGADTHGEVHIGFVKILANALLQVHPLKEKTYKGSWAKRGYCGTFYTIVRPWDRINGVFEDENQHLKTYTLADVRNRAFFDSLMDLALYCLKLAATIAQSNPEIMGEWAEENGAVLSKPVDYIPFSELEETDDVGF